MATPRRSFAPLFAFVYTFIAGFTSAIALAGPYSGTPTPIPGLIPPENYDTGGEGVGYHDTTAGNLYGAYRNDDVDIVERPGGPTGSLYHVAETKAGEWLAYTVEVAEPGTYWLAANVASDGDGGTFHVEFDGVDKTGPLTVPNTGGWHNFQPVRVPVQLSVGVQLMRIVMDSDGATGYVGSMTNLFVNRLAPYFFSVADYDLGGEGVAYHDTTPGNLYGAYRNDDVDIVDGERCACRYVAETKAGEWLQYSLRAFRNDTTAVLISVASKGPGGTFHLELDGVPRYRADGQSFQIPDTGDWQAFRDIELGTLPRNVRTLRIVFDSEGESGYVGNLREFRSINF